MKFLIIAPRFHTNLYYRAKALQDVGHIVKIISLYRGQSEFYEDFKPMVLKLSKFSNLLLKTLSYFKKGKLKSSFELRFQAPNKEFKKIIEIYSPDVILLKAYQNSLAIKTLLIAKKYDIKVLMLTQTSFTHIKGSKFLFKLNMKLFKFLKVHAYITPIKSNYDAFKNVGITNVFYLPFVYPSTIKNIKKTNQPVKILSVGKFQKRKEQLLLLEAFAKLVKETYNIKLCLVGEVVNTKYIKTLHNIIKKNKLSKTACIETNVPYSQMTDLYKNYDLFVLPAYNEPAAYSPVEALANGLPVICSDENGTKCYIEEAKNGHIFKAKNKKDLYEKFKSCISDKDNLNKMKKYALSLAKENHNMFDFEQNILKIIKS